MTPEQLTKALAGQGVEIATLKRRIKAAMLWQQLVQGKMRYEGKTVKADDVTAALLGSGQDKITTSEYTLQQILFVVPKGSSAGYVTQRRREAEAFRGALRRMRQEHRPGEAVEGRGRPQHRAAQRARARRRARRQGNPRHARRQDDPPDAQVDQGVDAGRGLRYRAASTATRWRAPTSRASSSSEQNKDSATSIWPNCAARRSSNTADVASQATLTDLLPLALTMGEPGGIGPDVTLAAWVRRRELDLPPFYCLARPDLLAGRARGSGIDCPIELFAPPKRSPASTAPCRWCSSTHRSMPSPAPLDPPQRRRR